jgi:hypothetical protein
MLCMANVVAGSEHCLRVQLAFVGVLLGVPHPDVLFSSITKAPSANSWTVLLGFNNFARCLTDCVNNPLFS